jgi:hypothetical protein
MDPCDQSEELPLEEMSLQAKAQASRTRGFFSLRAHHTSLQSNARCFFDRWRFSTTLWPENSKVIAELGALIGWTPDKLAKTHQFKPLKCSPIRI